MLVTLRVAERRKTRKLGNISKSKPHRIIAQRLVPPPNENFVSTNKKNSCKTEIEPFP